MLDVDYRASTSSANLCSYTYFVAGYPLVNSLFANVHVNVLPNLLHIYPWNDFSIYNKHWI